MKSKWLSYSAIVVALVMADISFADGEEPKKDGKVYLVLTIDGKVYEGSIVERTKQAIVLETDDGNFNIPRNDIESIKEKKNTGEKAKVRAEQVLDDLMVT